MVHLHLNAAMRNVLFNWLTRLPGFDSRWRWMKKLAKSWRIKELRRETDEAMRKAGRELAEARAALDEPDANGHKPRGVTLFDLQVKAADLQRLASQPAFYEADAPTEQYRIEDTDLDLLYTLTAPLRAEPEKGAEGPVTGDACKECGRGGKAVAGDYDVMGAICEAIETAREASKTGRPCLTCRARSEASVVPISGASGDATPDAAPVSSETPTPA